MRGRKAYISKEQFYQALLIFILITSFFSFITDGKWALSDLTHSFQESISPRGLSHKVLSMKNIIKKHPIGDFKLDGSLNNKAEIHQRSTEYLYPALMKSGSLNIFTYKKNADNLGINCKLIGEENGIKLYKCEQ